MNEIELFPKDNIIGSFKGHAEGGQDFAADLVIPYQGDEINNPQFGNFLLVQLSVADSKQAILGRITKVFPLGRLAGSEGEDYIERMRERKESVPPEIKERMIRYRVRIKLLGVLRVVNGESGDEISFMPSQRRLPNLGALVAEPSHELLRELCKLGEGKTEIGHFALGEFVYDGKTGTDKQSVHMSPDLPVTFNINNLVAKRTAVFARAGYGKSNLIKHLVSELYQEPLPQTENKRPVGMLIFDADGEYFWRDKNGRPGLCDVSHLSDKIIVFTPRSDAPEDRYKKWRAGDVKVDIRELNPGDVFSIVLAPDQQNQQNVRKLKSIDNDDWRKLVDLIMEERIGADNLEVGQLLGYKKEDQGKTAYAEIGAAISNVNYVVGMLHSPDSKFLSQVLEWLAKGGIVIIDVSLLSAKGGEILAGLLMKKIFSHNQKNFLSSNRDTKGGNEPIPVIAVIEEAQRTLGGNMNETSPFVEWVKEGRKYDLGAVMVTQQPGALAGELLSQVDNWFCFHVLSRGDAGVLEKYNSHFSDDICSHMIAEPIVGNCFMWSAPKQPFVLPVRVHEFTVGDGECTLDVAVETKMINNDKELEKELPEFFGDIIREEYKDGMLGLQDFCDGKWQGVKSGKLFYLIKDRPKLHRYADPNSRKRPLMEYLFKEIKMFKIDENGKEEAIPLGGDRRGCYYCALKEEWDRVLKR